MGQFNFDEPLVAMKNWGWKPQFRMVNGIAGNSTPTATELRTKKWNFKNGRWEKDDGASIWDGENWIGS